MSTFTERIKEAVELTAIAQAASKEAVSLDKDIKQRIRDNEAEAKVLRGTAFLAGIPFVDLPDLELEKMQTRLSALWDRERQARHALTILEREQVENGSIRLLSTSANRKKAQIAITYLREDGKKVSFTRHCQITDQGYVGLSTISTQKVIYRPDSAVAKAA
jgi:hypothetical protein